MNNSLKVSKQNDKQAKILKYLGQPFQKFALANIEVNKQNLAKYF